MIILTTLGQIRRFELFVCFAIVKFKLDKKNRLVPSYLYYSISEVKLDLNRMFSWQGLLSFFGGCVLNCEPSFVTLIFSGLYDCRNLN